MSQLGQYVRRALKGLWDGEIVYTYALRCPTGDKKLSVSMYEACLPYMTETVAASQPEAILCFGAGSMHTVIGRSYPPDSVRRGYAWMSTGTPVFFMQHPGYASRNQMIGQQVEADLRWALEPGRADKLPKPPAAGVVMMVSTPEEAREAIEDLELAAYITLDLETFGRPGNAEFSVLNMALTPDGADLAYVLDAPAMLDPSVREPMLEFLKQTPAQIGGANIKYDIVCLWMSYGARLKASWDTGLWRKLLDTNVMSRLEFAQPLIGMSGGKDEAKKYISHATRELNKSAKKPGPPPAAFNLTPEQFAIAVQRIQAGDEAMAYAYAAIPPEIRSVYNGLDTVSTDRVRQHLECELAERPNARAVWEKITQPLQHAIVAMEKNGLRADRSIIGQIQTTMAAEVATNKAVLESYNSEINWNHAPSAAKALTVILRRPVSSTAKDALAKYQHPAIDALLKFRSSGKFKAQYADSMQAFIRDDGRIHTNFNIAGTVTGRPSSEEPNLLNIPRPKTPTGKLCRDVFIAAEGCTLVEADYSQIELRVAAMLSGDDLMIQMFKDGVDFHLATAKMIAPAFQVDPALIDDKHWLRDAAKTVNFGVLYGTEAAGLAASLGITKEEAEKVVAQILGRFFKLKAWIAARLHEARKLGYAGTWWDGAWPFRQRPLPGLYSPIEDERRTAERCTWNTPVQGTAAEFTNASLGVIQQKIDVGELPPSSKLVLTVYDSIILECADADVHRLVAGVVPVMESWNSQGVPIVAEVKTGKAWGSLEKYKLPEAA